MKIVLDDNKDGDRLYPFTATRHTADIRIGILTIREKWNFIEGFELLEAEPETGTGDLITISANRVPTKKWLQQMLLDKKAFSTSTEPDTRFLEHPWQIFQLNDWALRQDFELITCGRTSQLIPESNKISCAGNIFIEAGAMVEHCYLNASEGPIYIGRNSVIMEGSMIRGPFALCEGSVVKMGAKIYGATTVGPNCIVGGEIKNSVLFGHTNKAHDGYLGDSVIGEWCNLGAGTTNSNVKNNAGNVKAWSKKANDFLPVGLKCGLLMGDYSRAAINTSFNTGTVAGVCCNIFGSDFPPKLVPDFTWGKVRYLFDKALEDIGNWKKLKGKTLTDEEANLLTQLYKQTS